MSIFSKVGEFLFGPKPQPVEAKVEEVVKQPLPPGPEVKVNDPVTPIQAVAEVAAPVTKKPRPSKKKEDGWLNNEVKKPSGKKPQKSTGKKVVKKTAQH